jgi:putative ABC transport system ATP-binding protein
MVLAAQVKELRKSYFLGTVEVPALRGVSLEFPEGDFVAIMGASGSGKSTLLNLLGCLDRPTGGQYLLAGQDVSRFDDDELSYIRNSSIGFIFQSYNLIPEMTVLENIEVPFFYRDHEPAEVRQRCLELAGMVGLDHRLDHCPHELSGGQQQRLAIARSLANDPVILLADEPTGNLDSQTSEEILQLLLSLNEEGKTIIMVTHDQDVAVRARRIVRLRDGQVVEDRLLAARTLHPASVVAPAPLQE